MFSHIRYRTRSAIALLLLVVFTKVAYESLCPIPCSEPLVDQQGIELDRETEAKLVAMVFDAVRQDDVTTVDEYLKSGFSPNVRSPRGDTLLIVAAYYDSLDVLKRLLRAPGIDIEARNRMGLTAVSGAAFKGHDRSLRVLIDAGADVNASNAMHQTALMFASISGRTSTTELLLRAGADPTRVDMHGNSARSLAEGQGAEAVTQQLSR